MTALLKDKTTSIIPGTPGKAGWRLLAPVVPGVNGKRCTREARLVQRNRLAEELCSFLDWSSQA
jgi:hypothetical protein